MNTATPSFVTRRLAVAALAAAAASIALPAAAQQSARLTIGAGHPAGASWIAAIRDLYMPRVAERALKEANFRIEWTEAFGGSVCKIGECLEAIESGLLDIGDPQVVFEPSKLQPYNFTLFVPFGSPDPRITARAVLETYDKVPQLAQNLERRFNQVLIAPAVIGNYGLVTAFTWSKPEDLRGKKIAAAGPNLPWLEGTGAVPVQSNLNEAYTSFQTGVYEAWIMFPDGVTGFKLNEVTKQYTHMNFGALHTPILTMNRDSFRKLPAAVQNILREEGRSWTMAMAEMMHARNEAAVKRLQEQPGYVVQTPDPATVKAWANALPNLPKIRAAEIEKAGLPGEIVYIYIAALKSAGHVFPRDWAAER